MEDFDADTTARPTFFYTSNLTVQWDKLDGRQ